MSGADNEPDVLDDTDTDEVDVLGAILDEVQKVRKEQERQGEEIEKVREEQDRQGNEIDKINGRLDTLSTTLEVVRSAQESHGLALGEMKTQCGRRFETCSEAMRKLRDRKTGDGKDTGSWPAEVPGE